MSHYSQIDYQEALLQASKSMIRVKDPVSLLKLITRFVDRQIRATHVGFLLYDKRTHSFVLINSRGRQGERIPVGFLRLDESNPLVKHFLPRVHDISPSQREAINLSVIPHHEVIEGISQHHPSVLWEFVQRWIRRSDSKGKYPLEPSDKNGFILQEISSLSRQMSTLKTTVCIPSYYKKSLVALMLLGEKLSGQSYDESEIKLFATLANDVAMAVRNADLIRDLRGALEKQHDLLIDTASALIRAIDARDRYTRGHSERVSHYTLVMASELIERGIVPKSREFLEAAQLSGLLHDVGKIGIRDEILNKPAKLSTKEFETMKTHVTIGKNIVSPVRGLKGLADGILYHHERWDGTGYPHNLRGSQIPLLGRIVCIVDSYDTMVTQRPYCKPMTPYEACEELQRCATTQFDPHLLMAIWY